MLVLQFVCCFTRTCWQTTNALEERRLCCTAQQKHETQKRKERGNTKSLQNTFLKCRQWRLTDNDGTQPGFFFSFFLCASTSFGFQSFGVVVSFFMIFCGLFGDSGESNGCSQDVLRNQSLYWPVQASACFFKQKKKFLTAKP